MTLNFNFYKENANPFFLAYPKSARSQNRRAQRRGAQRRRAQRRGKTFRNVKLFALCLLVTTVVVTRPFEISPTTAQQFVDVQRRPAQLVGAQRRLAQLDSAKRRPAK